MTFVTMFKVTWSAVNLWCKCCFCLSLPQTLSHSTVVRYTGVPLNASVQLCHLRDHLFHTSISCGRITLFLLIKVLLRVSILFWNVFSGFYKAFLLCGIGNRGYFSVQHNQNLQCLRGIYTALQRTEYSYENNCHLGFPLNLLCLRTFVKLTNRLLMF